MMGYLEAIVADRRRDIRGERELVALETLQEMALEREQPRNFEAAIRNGREAIIAEIKRRSPSAGTIDSGCDAAAVAAEFESGGANALSVVTEPRSFGGSFLDLTRARKESRLPVLCKDFIVDDFHLWKAAAFGADAVLLIVAILDDARLQGLLNLSSALKVAALVEVHDELEARRAIELGARVIGINNRDLQTFRVDLNNVPRVCAVIPNGLTIVAESGYTTAEQVQSAVRCGAHAVLVGDYVMRSANRAEAVHSLRAELCSK
jgi:indole-3-glycerol phosphate synthase